MKKNLLLTFFSFLALSLSYAQLPFNESFNTGIPTSWQNIDNTAGQTGGVWEWINDSGEQFAVFNSDGFGNDGNPEDADLITPAIDCSASSFVAVSFFSSFRQYANSVGTASISTDGGATWTSIYTVSATGGEVFLQDISAQAAGQSDVRFKFNFVGDWDFFWIIDDFAVYSPPGKDFAALELTTGLYYDIADAPITITGSLVNLGSETITSFDINYEIDGGTAVTAPITGVSIPFGGQYSFTHPTAYTPTATGTFEVTAYASNLNGGPDAIPANDEVMKSFLVYDIAVQRVPLFEIFTSSTCPPCLPGNESYHNIVDAKPDYEFVSVKLQQDFPGTGDPYATNELVARRNYYGVNSIPRMEIDGGWDGNANDFTNALYNDALANPAFTFLHATYELDVATQSVSVNVEGLPVEDYEAGTYKLHVAIIENETSQNVKTNGETEFLEVAKKMVPDNNGTTIASLTALTPYTFSTTYTFNGSFRLPTNGQAANRINHATEHSVEEFSDLRVVVWIENETTRTVLQAFNAVNPLDSDNDGTPDEVENNLGTNSNDAISVPDTDGDGQGDWKEVSAGTNPLDATSVGINELNFEMELAVSPVPASNVLNVSFTLESEEDVNLSLISVDGRIVASRTLNNIKDVQTSFDVSSMTNGVYFLEIETIEGVTSRKFVVNHE